MSYLKIFLIFIVFKQSETMTIDCGHNRQPVGKDYKCFGYVNLRNDSDQSKVTHVIENHNDGKTNSDVKSLWMNGQNLQSFPKGIENFFPNLEEIKAKYNDIKAITKDDLKVFPKLKLISFSVNQLTTLDNDLFTSTPNLQSIDFSENKIKYIGANTFKSLKYLEYLNFNDNNCFNGEAKTRQEVDNLIENLLIFCPMDNKTRSEAMILQCEYKNGIDRNGTDYQCKAEVKFLIALGQSKITAVTQDHIQGKTNNDVETLWIDYQNLSTFPKGIEQFFPNLKAIHASNSKIKAITKDDFKVFQRLQLINFSSNSLRTLDDDLFTSSPNLQSIDLSYNRIKYIETNAFKSLKNLEYLNLNENICFKGEAQTHEQVERLINKSLIFCPHDEKTRLETMILDCEYDEVNFTYQCKAEIKLLAISGQSKVTVVTQDHIQGKTNNDVETLRIEKRYTRKFPKGIEQFFPNLREIYATNSNIIAVTKEDLKVFPRLELIDFSGNKITALDDDLFTATPNLQSINFGNNEINYIGANTFESLKNLKYLNFNENICYHGRANTRREVKNLIDNLLIFYPMDNKTRSEAMILDCRYLAGIDLIETDYYCIAEVKFLVALGQSKITAVTHDHIQGKTNKNVETLWIIYQNLTTFPKGIEQFFPNLREIRASYNDINTVTKDNLNVFPKLELIDFFSNKITALDDDLFNFLPNLQSINFGNNEIKYIGANTFKSLRNLEYLNFNNNNCSNGEANTREQVKKLIQNLLIFCPMDDKTRSEAMILQCEYKEGTYLTGTDYNCIAKVKLLVALGQSKITAVSQDHIQGRTNYDVETLWIIYQNLTTFPKGIEQFFPNLKAIHASNNDINTVTKDNLKVFPKLELIDFFSNKITALDDDLFTSTPNLQSINFGNNDIKYIGANTFESLKNLEYLNFNGNNCFNGEAQTQNKVEKLIKNSLIFCPTDNKTRSEAMILQCEYKEGTYLTGTDYNCIAEVKFLVALGQSKITAVTHDHVQGKTNNDVKALWIDYQNLSTFPKGIEQFFQNLKGIRASFNKINAVTKDDFKVFPGLQFIDFSGNKITALDDDLFTSTPNLQSIDFSKNKIEYIGANTFESLKNLDYLNFNKNICFNGEAKTHEKVGKLINNSLIFCPMDNKTRSEAMILDCEYKEGIDLIGTDYHCKAEVKFLVALGQSKITAVTHDHVQGKTNNDVKALWIDYQNLSTFPKGIEQFFQNLKGIRASFNKIKAVTKDDLKVFPRLQFIDFSGNKITALDDDIFSSTPNLQYINFGNNQIMILNPNLFSSTPNLKEVDFHVNRIKHIGKNTFAPLKNLTKLFFYGEKNCVDEYATTRDQVEVLISKFSAFCPTVDANELIFD